tara:strand:+ start:227 stop:469 length:243 start_codon:yes stop_codon:yes gene_type:complete
MENDKTTFKRKNNSEHFVELLNKRVPKSFKYLDLVGNLANKSNYSYTVEQSKQIKKLQGIKLMRYSKSPIQQMILIILSL